MGWVERLFGREGGRSGNVPETSGRGRDDPFAFISDPGEIPPGTAYPTQDSYPLLNASGVLVAHRDQVRQAYRAFDARDLVRDFDAEFARLMTNFAGWVSLLPASKRYHHSKPGGLFAQSLDVATKALHYSAGFIVNQDSAPRDRDVDKFAWGLAAFLCGLLHDIGKVETNGIVVARGVRRGGGEWLPIGGGAEPPDDLASRGWSSDRLGRAPRDRVGDDQVSRRAGEGGTYPPDPPVLLPDRAAVLREPGVQLEPAHRRGAEGLSAFAGLGEPGATVRGGARRGPPVGSI